MRTRTTGQVRPIGSPPNTPAAKGEPGPPGRSLARETGGRRPVPPSSRRCGAYATPPAFVAGPPAPSVVRSASSAARSDMDSAPPALLRRRRGPGPGGREFAHDLGGQRLGAHEGLVVLTAGEGLDAGVGGGGG